jgi:hypothetical protein
VGRDTILHYDGKGTCTTTTAPAPSDLVDAVWASGPDDAWVGDLNGNILHWDGTSWTVVLSMSADDGVYGIWGSGAHDVWAVGVWGSISHWDGTAWSPSSSPNGTDYHGVWGTPGGGVWAVAVYGILHHP